MTRRISDTELERIKGSLDLVAEVRKRGIGLKLKGKELVGLCPFHEEKTPSFSVVVDADDLSGFGLEAVVSFDFSRNIALEINNAVVSPLTMLLASKVKSTPTVSLETMMAKAS